MKLKRTAISFGFWLALGASAFAQMGKDDDPFGDKEDPVVHAVDWGKRERPPQDPQLVKVQAVSCPLCAAQVERVTVLNVREDEWDTDFKVTRANLNVYPWVLMTCPKCSYSNYSAQFHKPVSEDQRKKVAEALKSLRREFADYWSIPHSFSLRTAEATHRALESGEGTLFEVCLLGAYLARDLKETQAEREWQIKGLSYLVAAIEKDEAYQRPRMRYLAGELCRRLERYKEAREWFVKAKVGASEDLLRLIQRQDNMTQDAMDSKGKKK